MEAPNNTARHQLARLQVYNTASFYRPKDVSSNRVAVVAPDQALREVDHVEINRIVEREGVTYYVLEVFRKDRQAKPTRLLRTPMVGIRNQLQVDGDHDDGSVDPDERPASIELERRYSDFAALRHQLLVCFENLHPGYCAYCDAFIGFLTCSRNQPGTLTKLTTRPPQRVALLGNVINRTIELALARVEDTADNNMGLHCDGRWMVPQVVGCFIRD